MTRSETPTAFPFESLRHPRCPALGGEVPFRQCRTSGTDQPCPRIPECWWNRPEVLQWFVTTMTDNPSLPRDSRLQTILKTLARVTDDSG